ncbi:MAG: DMT family transporter [Bacillota bacterium]
MSGKLLSLLIAAFSGAAMAFQGTLNTAQAKVIGLLEATFVVHLVGLAFVSLLLFVPGLGQGKLSLLGQAPLYTYLGGVLGVIIIYCVARSIPVVGVAPATTSIILGQILTATIIDHFGLFGMEKLQFSWYRVGGTLLMACGAWLLLRK